MAKYMYNTVVWLSGDEAQQHTNDAFLTVFNFFLLLNSVVCKCPVYCSTLCVLRMLMEG